MDEEKIIFTALDPLNRSVTLTGQTWTVHITGDSGHDEVLTEHIKSNIENPRYILQNVKPKKDGSSELIIDDSRQDYVDIIPKGDRIYGIKTIVEFDKNNNGTIVTNHILRNIKEIKTIGGVIYDSKQNKSSTGFTTL
ncbi:hypothetical protein [Clostridium sp.]|uniref:hypothetical protein n=1 Tax=Clostridium sp. TaxID=1506 RepID=UPI00260B7B1C|nr:hypothetical protein [Clostridium sp.]